MFVRVGNVEYSDFPSVQTISQFPGEVIKSFLIFCRRLGICSVQRLAIYLGAKETDTIQALLLDAGLTDKLNPDDCQRNLERTKLWQQEIVKDTTGVYYISLKRAMDKARRGSIHPNGCFENAVKSMLQESRQQKIQYLKENVKSMNTITIEQRFTKPISALTKEDVERVARHCPVEPIRDFRTAFATEDYMKKLNDYFPDVSSPMIVTYLFDNKVGRFYVGSELRRLGINKPRTSLRADTLFERAAFIHWAGGNYENYLLEEEKKSKKKSSETRAFWENKKGTNVAPSESEPEVEKEEEEMIKIESKAESPSAQAQSEPYRLREVGAYSINLRGDSVQILKAVLDITEKYGLEVESFYKREDC